MNAGDNTKWFRQGEVVPDGSKLIMAETRHVSTTYEEAPHPMLEDTPVKHYAWFYLYQLDYAGPGESALPGRIKELEAMLDVAAETIIGFAGVMTTRDDILNQLRAEANKRKRP